MPIKHFTAFISYSHKDGEELAKELQHKINADDRGNAITFWQDYSQMKYGQWSKQIENAIDAVEFLIMLITPAALASPNCKDEWMYARKKGVAVLPVNGKPDDADFYHSFPNWLKKQHIYHPEKNWERFINDLNTKPEIPKVPFMAPRLSEVGNYVERSEKLKRLKELLLKADEPVSITTALQGSGGFGKTILAIALCNDGDIMQAFDDGILWVTLGQQKDTALNAMQKLYDAVSNNTKNFIDTEQAQQSLNEKLSGKNYLLVLDDVWHRVDAENILKAAGKCTVLITTRMDKLLLNAKQEHVDEMTKDEAIAQLTKFTGTGNTAYIELGELAEKLGNWALLLRLAGAQLKARIDEGESIEQAIVYVNKKLERKGLFGFDREDAEQRNDSVQICLAASIDLLKNEEKEKLYSLGIFPEDENIPFAVLENYWELDDFDCEELLEKFHRYGLIDLDVPSKTIKMHDILLKYYETSLKDKPAQHLLLVKRFGDFNTWANKYIWQWCIWHLSKAGANEDVTRLLTNYYWIEDKLSATKSLYDITSDYDLIPLFEEIRLIQKALLLSAAIIGEDPAQLPQQLYGRLGSLDIPLCRQLSEQALKAICGKEATLKPLYPGLEIPDFHNLVFRGHSDSVYGALIQGDTLISWSSDNTLRSWNLLSGKTKQVFEGHSSYVYGALIQGDTLLSWSDDNTLRSWDLLSGKTKQVFEGHSSWVTGALIQGDTLISWSSDNTLRSWNLLSGKTKQVFEGHSDSIDGVLVQGDTLISWSSDNTLRSWNLLSGKTKQVFEGHSDSIDGALILGDTLISWSDDKTLLSWDLLSGKTKQVFEGHSDSIDGALILGDTLISWSDDKTLLSWDLLSGKTKQVFEGHSSWVTGALIQGDTLISWSDDKTLRSWDILSGKTKQVFEGHSSYVKGALIQGDTLISWSDDKTLRSWDLLSGKTKQVFEGHSSYVKGALIQSDTLISWSDDKTLRSWDLLSGRTKQVFEGHSSSVYEALIQADTLISLSDDKTLRSWDILSGKTKQVFEGNSSLVYGAFIHGDTLISWSGDKTLRSWDILSGKTKQVFEGHSDSIDGALIQGDTLISWSNDKTLRSWDILSGKTKQVFEGNSSLVYGALIQGDTLISWFSDKTLRSWDILSGKTKQVFEGHSDSIDGALIQGDTLISWSDDNTLRSWDLLSGRTKQVFEGHSSSVYKALIHGDTLISWTGDKTLRSWDFLSGKTKQVFEGHSDSVKGALIQGDTLISWNENELLIWKLSSAEIVRCLETKKNEVQVQKEFLYLVDMLNTLWIYRFPTLDYVCRFTIDADITMLQIASNVNRIILGDAFGRMHFLEPIGFKI